MSTTANRGCKNAVQLAFASMKTLATDTQRNLSRSLLPLVQQSMNDSYQACLSVPRGTGVFNRMKNTMHSSTSSKVSTMFQSSNVNLLKGIDDLVQQLVTLIGQTAQTINKHLEDVYSIYWDDQNDESKMVDPEMQRKVRQCRDALLPDLNKLCSDLVNIHKLVGIEREALDLDVTAVESLDDVIKRTINEAKEGNEIIDLCDSEEDFEDVLAKLPPAKNSARNMKSPHSCKVKSEPGLFDV
ncbi:hypothetical protein CTEN210_17576 [Chaetoceros tenuissimus]|uniref:Uncharacterized protein n=1 Tax=Chaetoceros tenuissimus TaxID=426638 RepID=A0AAD3HEW9_9STRA|nr:hypothetical protein CTEN210_17576 [Chaetoceros tenuissimus]